MTGQRVGGLVVLGALAAICVIWGVPNLRVALRERSPLEISCADYLQRRPSADRLRLTGCEVDPERISFRLGENGDVTDLSFVLRPLGARPGQAGIVVRRTDRELRNSIMDRRANREMLPWMEFNPETPQFKAAIARVFAKPVEGSVGEDRTAEFEELGTDLARGVTFLEDKAIPPIRLPILAVIFGAIGGLTLLVALIRIRRELRTMRTGGLPQARASHST